MRTLIVIPAYNEEESIGEVVLEIRKVAPWADLLVIDDQSSDRTFDICLHQKVPVLSLPVNLGIGGVVQTGYLYALRNGYDAAVQMDGDGQHDPAMLERLLTPLREGTADVAIGSRFLANLGDFRSTRLRRVGIRFFEQWIRLLSGASITDATSGFRACNRKGMRLFISDYAKDYPEPEAVMTALRNHLIVREVPVSMRERQGGVSSIRRLKSVYYMLKVSIAILISACKPLWENRHEEPDEARWTKEARV